MTLFAPRGPRGPGFPSAGRDHAGRAADRSGGDLVVPRHERQGVRSARGGGRDPFRGPRDDRGLLPRALLRDLPKPKRRPQVPQERAAARMVDLRGRKRQRGPIERDRLGRRPVAGRLRPVVAQRRRPRDHDGRPGARIPRAPGATSIGPTIPSASTTPTSALSPGWARARRARSTCGMAATGWPWFGSTAPRRACARSTTGEERKAGHGDHFHRDRREDRAATSPPSAEKRRDSA